MQPQEDSRREFLKKSAVGVASLGAAAILTTPVTVRGKISSPAALGGTPVRTGSWPSWPQGYPSAEANMKEILGTSKWTRIAGDRVIEFEKKWGKKLGAKYCFAVNGGTSALHCALYGIGLQPGDEVLVSPIEHITGASLPFTFYALPVFVDIDPDSSQMDPDKIEEKITEHTKAIIPCHWSSAPADMDRIMAIARKHNLYVVEDACQAHLSEWRGKKLGTVGDVGCFSHQQSKVMPCGEGGSVAGNNEKIMNLAYSWHDYGRDIRDWDSHKPDGSYMNQHGLNYKLTEFQAALLLSYLDMIDDQIDTREDNADYLRELLAEIPGITPQKLYDGTTRVNYYIFVMRYDKKQFNNLPKKKLVKALGAEGIPVTTGFRRSLSEQPYVMNEIEKPAFQKMYSKTRLDRFKEMTPCPVAEEYVREEQLYFSGKMLLTTKSDMEAIADAFRKVREHSKKLHDIKV